MFEKLLENVSGYSGVYDNSSKVTKNSVFVAVKGLKHDGHDFVEEAIKKGATLIIGQKDLKPKAPYIKVEDSREALGQLASAINGYPSKKLKVIGVTGTKGKTTTSHLIYHILTNLGKKTGLVSSIVAKIGTKETDTGFHVTSPDAISLHKFLKEMVDEGCKYAVLEVSSHGIDQKRIAGVEFEIGVLTNIAPEHLDYHKTFEEYKKVKMSFINSARHKVISPRESDLNILPGKFNNLNIEAAIAAVGYFDIDRQSAINALSSFHLPEGRLEEIKNDLGIKIYVDFAHTPESLEAALQYIKENNPGNVITVFGCAGERDPYKRPKMGKVAAELSDEVILTAEDPRTEPVNEIISEIRSGMPKGFENVYSVPDRTEAIKKAIKMAGPGDVVGIFGKGHEKSMNLDGKSEIPWSDKEVIEKILEK
jgi:UDP-N-acetylmuramoyl-L-alanyl-D-glutamate--2,6-diaminopimelate ligase